MKDILSDFRKHILNRLFIFAAFLVSNIIILFCFYMASNYNVWGEFTLIAYSMLFLSVNSIKISTEESGIKLYLFYSIYILLSGLMAFFIIYSLTYWLFNEYLLKIIFYQDVVFFSLLIEFISILIAVKIRKVK